MKRLLSLFLALTLWAAGAWAEEAEDILAMYRLLMAEEEAPGRLAEAGLCYMAATNDCPAGYAFMDLDGDGTDELVIGAMEEDPEAFSFGLLYDVFALREGHYQPVLSSMERDRYYLRADGMIVNMYSSGAMESGFLLYEWKDGALSRVGGLEYDENSSPDAPWRLLEDGFWREVDIEEALAWMDEMEASLAGLTLTEL